MCLLLGQFNEPCIGKIDSGTWFSLSTPFSPVSTVPSSLCVLIGTDGHGLGTLQQSNTLLDVENRGTEVLHCWLMALKG